MWYLYLTYAANILVAGWISISSMFFRDYAAKSVFSSAYESTEVMQLTGCLWFGIACLSVFGLFRPIWFSPVLIMQLIYKGMWLLIVAIPALRVGRPLPGGMAVFFVVWVIVLPFVIPWSAIFSQDRNYEVFVDQKVE